jgi:hypothetical protein
VEQSDRDYSQIINEYFDGNVTLGISPARAREYYSKFDSLQREEIVGDGQKGGVFIMKALYLTSLLIALLSSIYFFYQYYWYGIFYAIALFFTLTILCAFCSNGNGRPILVLVNLAICFYVYKIDFNIFNKNLFYCVFLMHFLIYLNYRKAVSLLKSIYCNSEKTLEAFVKAGVVSVFD